jgi:hypothetical protein
VRLQAGQFAHVVDDLVRLGAAPEAVLLPDDHGLRLAALAGRQQVPQAGALDLLAVVDLAVDLDHGEPVPVGVLAADALLFLEAGALFLLVARHAAVDGGAGLAGGLGGHG